MGVPVPKLNFEEEPQDPVGENQDSVVVSEMYIDHDGFVITDNLGNIIITRHQEIFAMVEALMKDDELSGLQKAYLMHFVQNQVNDDEDGMRDAINVLGPEKFAEGLSTITKRHMDVNQVDEFADALLAQ